MEVEFNFLLNKFGTFLIQNTNYQIVFSIHFETLVTKQQQQQQQQQQ
jgi:hypothetical protein